MLFISQHLDQAIRRKDVADRLHISEAHLGRLLKKATGTGFGSLLASCRVEEASAC